MIAARTEQVSLKSLCEVTAGPSGSLLDNLHDGPDGVPVISPVVAAIMVAAVSVRVRMKSMPWSAAAWMISRLQSPPGTPKKRLTP